ncbi:hypothetical protein niasHT_004768 [Heterodera trifolii]|uniref:SKP1 component dimerisation domain-containing protein n=1 Tax=Heterodera trifolii TaxID=157864 RepID=A0ABD2MCS3_9BILA
MSAYPQELLQKNIACKCRDGDLINVPFYLLLQSKTFTDFWKIHAFSSNEIPADYVFSMEIVPGEVFIKVVDWMGHRNGKDDPVVRTDPRTNERIPLIYNDFERNFFDIQPDMLMDLVQASNFLCINSLVSLLALFILLLIASFCLSKYLYCTHSLASLVKGKTLEQIRAMLNVECDLNERQQEEIRAKNVWCLY